MATASNNEDSPANFHHPYTPYSVQLEFMRTAYSVLSKGQGQIGILESPTGTGKSLSLICSAVTWLRDHKRSRYETSLESVGGNMQGEPEWMIEVALKRRREELGKRWEERESRLERLRAKEKEMEERGRERERKRVRREEKGEMGRDEEEEDEAYWIGDWEGGGGDDYEGLSRETREMMARVGMGGGIRKEALEEEEEGDEGDVKVCKMREGSGGGMLTIIDLLYL